MDLILSSDKNISKNMGLGVQKESHSSAIMYIFIGTSHPHSYFVTLSYSPFRKFLLFVKSTFQHIQTLLGTLLPLLALMRLRSLRTMFPLYPLNTALDNCLSLFCDIYMYICRYIYIYVDMQIYRYLYISCLKLILFVQKTHNHFLSLLLGSYFHSWNKFGTCLSLPLPQFPPFTTQVYHSFWTFNSKFYIYSYLSTPSMVTWDLLFGTAPSQIYKI